MQSNLSSYFLRQDVIDKLIAGGESDSKEASRYANRLVEIAHIEDSEHAGLEDPFDRSVAIVFELFRDEDLDPWNVDLSQFLKLFGERIKKDSKKMDLPACGRLIRLAWEVLHGQAADLLDRALRDNEEETDDLFIDWGWEMEYDDDEFSFTTNVLTGSAEPQLPSLFNERIRRDEGRQVTLGELLSALKDACDDADDHKLREENRIRYAEDVKKALSNVGARMHDEDLDGDIQSCWQAMKKVALENGRKLGDEIPVEEVIAQLRADLLHEYGTEVDGLDGEANVTAFISTLFLTHRGYADVRQKVVPNGQMVLVDRWPQKGDFHEVRLCIEGQKNELSERIKSQAGGRVQHIQRMAKRAEEAARKEAAAAAAAAAAQAEAEAAAAEEFEADTTGNAEGPVIEITLPEGMGES
jgi:segregation and condensation protein A